MPINTTLATLEQIGLSAEEAAIYHSLLQKGPQGASELAKSTTIKRTYVYAVCTSLITKGLASKQQKGRTTIFTAQNPTQLQSLAQEHSLKASTALFGLENFLPQLISQYTASSAKPVISYFEGIEGVKKTYLDTIAVPDTTMYSLVTTATIEPEIYRWLTHEYVQERIKRHVNVQAIVATGDRSKQYIGLNTAELRESKAIDGDKYPITHEICIYESKITLIHHRAGSQLLGIIIAHPMIAKTFRAWFDLTWSLLP
jgi:sugar-specific transcriptional regulator TrmB